MTGTPEYNLKHKHQTLPTPPYQNPEALGEPERQGGTSDDVDEDEEDSGNYDDDEFED